MSGGYWNYSAEKYEDAAKLATHALGILAVIGHELDWGHSGDTCLTCARRRVTLALDAFFDHEGDSYLATLVARDTTSAAGYCDACLTQMPRRGRQPGVRQTLPTLLERDAEMVARGLPR